MKNKAFWIVILLFALMGVCALCGLIGVISFTSPLTVYNGGVSEILNGNVFQQDLVMAEADSSQEYTPAGQLITLEVHNPYGDISIQGGDQELINMRLHTSAGGPSAEIAQETLDKIDLEVLESSEKIIIRVKYPDAEVNGHIQADLIFEVPAKINLLIQGGSGNVTASRIQGAVTIGNDFGNVQLDDIQSGAVEISSQNGMIEVQNIRASEQAVTLSSQFGSLKLARVAAKTLTADTKNGELSASDINVSGQTELSSDFGTITLRGGKSGGLKAQSQNGIISVQGLTLSADLLAYSDFGNVEISQAYAPRYDLQSKNGSITLNGADQAAISALTDFGSIEIRNAKSAQLNLETKSGLVQFYGSLSNSEHLLRTSFGDIRLRLPSNQPLNLDLNTGFGVIQSEFELTTSQPAQEKHWQGSINGGGGLLTVQTENGSITLEKSISEE